MSPTPLQKQDVFVDDVGVREPLLDTRAAVNSLDLKHIPESAVLQPAPTSLRRQRGHHPCRGDNLVECRGARKEIGHILRGLEGLHLAPYVRVQRVSRAPGFQPERFWDIWARVAILHAQQRKTRTSARLSTIQEDDLVLVRTPLTNVVDLSTGDPDDWVR